MIGLEAVRMAARSLREHKVRSLLTLIGVVVGIGSVITVVTLGASFEASVISQFDDFSDRAVFVTATQSEGAPGPPDAGQFGTLYTKVDADRLSQIENVEQVVPSGAVSVTGLSFEERRLPFRSLTATLAGAQQLQDSPYSSGGPFEDGALEAVISSQVANALGARAGDEVRVFFPGNTTRDVHVAGVLSPNASQLGPSGEGVFVPLDPFHDETIESPSTGNVVPVYSALTVIAGSPEAVEQVRTDVRSYVLQESDARLLAPEGIELQVATTSDIVDQIGNTFDQVTLFVAAIALISLVVGAIGIANIMLVSVVERTEEIGIMRAVGALDRDILSLFLVEAVLVGLVGTVIGIAFGLGLGAGLIEVLFSDSGAPFAVPWDWLGVATLVGIGTGAVAGYFPARRATRVDPVQALTRE